jgi:hypothetical protein
VNPLKPVVTDNDLRVFMATSCTSTGDRLAFVEGKGVMQ